MEGLVGGSSMRFAFRVVEASFDVWFHAANFQDAR